MPLSDEECDAVRGLMKGLAAAGLTDPAALAAAGILVKREQLSAQLVVANGELLAQNAELDKSRQAYQAKVADIQKQIADLNTQVGK